MAEHLAYSVAKRKKQVIEFSIYDEEYHFTVPKTALMVLDALQSKNADEAQIMAAVGQFAWFSEGLPEEESDRILKLLEDKDESFDWEDVEKLIIWIQKQIEGRPTT